MGDVHLCVDVPKRRLVVVKWLRAELSESSDSAHRFRREAALMAGTELHGVIKVEDHGAEDTGRTWMAMEFVDGVSPASCISAGDGWGVHRLLEGAGRSLDELHGLGIVHRDLKPDNIILRNLPAGNLPWEPVIIDLGIAKWLALEAATATGAVFGTPHYMSPEQFRDSKRVGPATDRYALAVIAYELMTGRLPFDGRSLPDLLRQHAEAPVPPLRVPTPQRVGEATLPDLGATVPVQAGLELDAFMARAMAKEPGRRFGSGAEMAVAFRQAAMTDGLWREPPAGDPLFPALRHPRVELWVPGANASVTVDVREGPVVLGRHDTCQVKLGSPRLSRFHACIYRQRGRLWVADLHSQNGSGLHGRPLQPGAPVPLVGRDDEIQLTLYDQEVRVRTHAA